MKTLSTPYPWLDLDVMEQNIRRMTMRLADHGIRQRPHIKTHKSVELAKMQLSLGAVGITCAKLSEAEVMAKAGIKDILIAYPLVGSDKMKRLERLMSMADITVTSDNMVNACELNHIGENLKRKISVLIEIGSQNQRGGFFDDVCLLDFTEKLTQLPWIHIKGIFTYVGLGPGLSEPGMLEVFAKEEGDLLYHAKGILEKAGVFVETVSAGSSATSMFPEMHGPITESRAGSYIFNDINSVKIHTADLENCALKVRTTVVSMPKDGLATIDAGSKSLSSDTRMGQGYGTIVGHPEIELYKLNEEHGFLRFDSKKTPLTIGQQLDIIPNHACVIGNLHDYYFAFRNGEFDRRIRVDARGKNY